MKSAQPIQRSAEVFDEVFADASISRQVRRALKRQAVKNKRPGLRPPSRWTPFMAKAPRSHILKTWIADGREYSFHATKGLRSKLVTE